MLIWSIIFIVSMNARLMSAVSVNCKDYIEEKPTDEIVPAHYETEIESGYQYFVDDKVVYEIYSIETICDDITFPLNYEISKDCTNCLKTLIIKSIFGNEISSAAFTNTSSFNIIYLNNINIATIDPGAFGLQSLVEIYLSGNNLTEIGVGLFNTFHKLKKIDISNNNIKTVLPKSFIGTTNLKWLNLSKNELIEFSSNTFDLKVIQIEFLDISFNKLSNFNMDIYVNIANLSLNNNQIKQIGFCPFTFSSLRLDNNILEGLPVVSCNTSENNLVLFDLSFNNITNIKQFYFKDASLLEYLYLNHNNISIIPTGAFYNLNALKELNISQNKLEQFDYGTFDSLQNLQVLDLSYNKIKTVKSIFHVLTKLRELYLHNNKINKIDSWQFMHIHFPHLSSISFHNNIFSCDELMQIITDIRFDRLPTVIVNGNVRNFSNIHGIACSDNHNLPKDNFESLKLNIENLVTSLLKQTNNKNHKYIDIIKNYFNNEFENSDFYKFIANFLNLKSNATEIFHYFKEDFVNSKLYNYLENLNDSKNFNDISNNIYAYFNTDFKNSNFVKYLDDSRNYKISLNENFSKSSLYNYINKDFETSKFYKYLESLKALSPNIKDNSTVYDKLTITEKYEDKILAIAVTVNTVFIIIMCCLLSILIYRTLLRTSVRIREQVELL